MRHRWLLLAGLAFCLGTCGRSEPSYPQRQPPAELLTDSAAQRAGARSFHQHCASCHGTTAEGRSPRADFFQPPAPDFTAPKYAGISPAYLYWRIEKGKTAEPYLSQGSVMPAWGPYLSEEEIWQLVAYLKTRSSRGRADPK